MKISNIIRRGGMGREREGGHSYIKSLIKLEREDPKKEGFKKNTITSKLEKMKN